MKIHLGCGTVYLKDYINCDVKAFNHFLAKDRPDLVAHNITTVDKYYKYDVSRQDIENRIYNKSEVVVDMYAMAGLLPFADKLLDEIRCVQVFEHFSIPESKGLLKHWKFKLRKGGKLHIDIPDLDETIKGYYESKTEADREWFTRLLYGSHKNKYGIHKMMYTKESIKKLLEEFGFKNIKILPNIHFYPAFAVEAEK